MDREFNRVVDVLPGLVWTALPDGHVDFVNRQWCVYTGSGLDRAAGDGWLAAIHPDDVAELRDRWRNILATHQPQDITARVRRGDGISRWFVLRVRPLTDDDGTLARWCGMLVDIEDHRPAERDSDGMVSDFCAIADVIPASVLLMSPDGDIEYANRQSREFRGATLEQQRGWKSADLIHPEELPAAIAEWERCVRTGDLFEMEFRARRADGVYRWFHVRSRPMRDTDGRITRWCTLDVDIDDRKRGEAQLARTLAELAASEERLRTIVDAIPGFVWSAEPDGSVDFLNRRWCDYTGLPMRGALGNGWTSTIHPDDSSRLQGLWRSLLESGQAGEYETRLLRSDGTSRWFLVQAVPLRNAEGRIVKWYGQNTDIEDRKRAELMLEGEKHLLGLMAGNAPLLQVLTALCELAQDSMDGALCSVVLIDPRQTRATKDVSLRLRAGAGPNIPGNLLEDADGRPLEPDASPLASSAMRGEPVVSTDLAAETRWNAWRSAALAHGFRANWSMPIRHSGGNVVGVFSILFREPKKPEALHHDLIAQFTHLASIAIERARSEAALKQSDAFLAKAQRVSATGTLLWRVATDEITWSEEVYRIYEFDPALPVTFERIYSRIHPDDVPSHRELSRRQRMEARDFEHEHRLLMPDRSVKYLHFIAHATRDDDGNLEYIGTVQDVTQRRLSSEALNKVRSELTHVARVASLGALTASIAHEVNQPLAGIITNANTCLRMLGAEPPNVEGARETARRTIRDGNRASDVIKRLRALFSKKTVVTESVDLNEATREVIAMLLGELRRSGVIVRPELADDLPFIRGDRVQLQQVILNLIMNARDAMSEVLDRPREMRVSTHRERDGRIRLAVSDCGSGFDPHNADRLFEAFYTTKSSGMGIGLSVSRSIIEGHEGRLWATSNKGPGATFAFSLPAAENHVAAEPEATRAPPVGNAETNRAAEGM